MKYHTQRDLGQKYGSCIATCFACILDMDLEAVPNFGLFARYIEAVDLWAFQHGLQFHLAGEGGQTCFLNGCGQAIPKEPVVAIGKSPRAGNHAVVWDPEANKLLWDPHPSREGIIRQPERFGWFTKRLANA